MNWMLERIWWRGNCRVVFHDGKRGRERERGIRKRAMPWARRAEM